MKNYLINLGLIVGLIVSIVLVIFYTGKQTIRAHEHQEALDQVDIQYQADVIRECNVLVDLRQYNMCMLKQEFKALEALQELM